MKTDIKFTVRRLDRAIAEDQMRTTEGRIEAEQSRLRDELNELQQVEEQLTARVESINERLDLLRRLSVPTEAEETF